MKHLTLFLAFFMTAFVVTAQDDYNNSEIQTIFSKQRNGAYGALSIGYSQIDGRDALVTGARGAFIFSRSFAIGLGGYGFINDLDYNHRYGEPEDHFMLAGGYGGLFLEPILGGDKAVHLSFPVLIGMGAAALIDDYDWDWPYDHDYHELDSDIFFVIEPGLELEFNMARFFRTAIYASYRFTSDLELYDTDDNALRGLNVGMIFKFGRF